MVSKSIYVGESYTLKLKNVSAKAKVTWTTSKKSVVAVVKKKGNRVVLKGKKQGKASITAKYKGKKYRCKITVKNKEQTKEENTDNSEKTEKEEPVMNAAEVDLYYLPEYYKDKITYDENHLSLDSRYTHDEVGNFTPSASYISICLLRSSPILGEWLASSKYSITSSLSSN